MRCSTHIQERTDEYKGWSGHCRWHCCISLQILEVMVNRNNLWTMNYTSSIPFLHCCFCWYQLGLVIAMIGKSPMKIDWQCETKERGLHLLQDHYTRLASCTGTINFRISKSNLLESFVTGLQICYSIYQGEPIVEHHGHSSINRSDHISGNVPNPARLDLRPCF